MAVAVGGWDVYGEGEGKPGRTGVTYEVRPTSFANIE